MTECAAGGSPGKARRRRGVVSRKKEQRRQVARPPCNRVRSGFTQKVRLMQGGTFRIHRAFLVHRSGQLPFLGLLVPKPWATQ
ncbi:hypothetical protein [Methylocaldum sp. RMAD-M]|uniref:hypothetical protein n=1 Tax=Methylocaldum sp. RMAD-M TaxID=2806557 RepID=UPI001AE1DCFB|nr:hypothetical protein [Methylocaldum sp. RMAD-M]